MDQNVSLETVQAANGQPNILAGNKNLYSMHNPQSTAERTAAAWANKKKPTVLVVIGDPLNYYINSFKKIFPQTLVYGVLPEPFKTSLNTTEGKAHCLNITEIIDPLDDALLTSTEIFMNPGFANAFPEFVESQTQILFARIQARASDIFTSCGFGKIWLKNICRNLLSPMPPAKPVVDRPVLICASGPSLKENIRQIAEYRKEIFLVGVSTALPFLIENGIIPDTVFVTDPGYWVRLSSAFPGRPSLSVIMPLSADSGFARNGDRFLLYHQDSLYEKLLFQPQFGGLPALPLVASAPTVSGSAYLFFSSMPGVPICFTGLDLCSRNTLAKLPLNTAHSKTGYFVNRETAEWRAYANKENIELDDSSDRPVMTNRSWNLFAEWFKSLPQNKSLYSLAPSSPLLAKNIETISLQKLISHKSPVFKINESNFPFNYDKRKSAVLSLIQGISFELKTIAQKDHSPLAAQILHEIDLPLWLQWKKSGILDLQKLDEDLNFLNDLKSKTEKHEHRDIPNE